MKRLTILVVLFSFMDVYGQNHIIYHSKDKVLSVDMQTNKYCIWEDSEQSPNSNWVLATTDISSGRINFSGIITTCIDSISNLKIVFQKLDEFRLVVKNQTECFTKNDTLYATVITDYTEKSHQWMEWKNGKRHGLWCIGSNEGANYTLYNQGHIVKTYFKTYKQLKEERMNVPIEGSSEP